MIFLAGLVVYAGYGLTGLVVLLAAVGLTYVLGLLIPKRPWLMWAGVVGWGLLLTVLKVQSAFQAPFLSVMGMSYFTLQIISYLVDVRKGKYPPERNLFRFALYLTYLPHLFIGPIERYDAMAPRLQSRRITWEGILSGGARALWGGFKKLVIAARAGVIVGAISAEPEKYRGGFALCAMLLYSVQLYADFSGGMDMVLGLSEMLGLPLSENFDRPYFSESVQEFWKRWHITLGAWLRDYVYIPLGGSRKGMIRKVLNTLVTFLVSGLWHGVNYLLWGLLNGLFVCFGGKCKTRWKSLNRVGTFLVITLLWSFFIWPDPLTALEMVGSLFTDFSYGSLAAGLAGMGLSVGDWIVFAAASALLWLYDWKMPLIHARLRAMPDWGKTAVICALAPLVLVFGRYGLGFQTEAFIYSRF